ncbi:MAG: sugar phosphate isomerase/epimerase [Planctomycetaceae bacterium]|nr:MAG: sugar phosphate isomerase/epimerase [Planctomycetaceae bacterium]
MKRISLSQLTTLRWDLNRDLDAAIERGLGGVGLWRPKVEDIGHDETLDLLQTTGLKPSSLSWAGGFTGSDGRRYNDAVDDAIEAVELAYRLGVETLVILPGGRNNHIRRHLHKTICQALVEVNSIAASWGVRLAIEPFHPGCGDEWSFLSDVRATLDVITSIGDENVGLTLDTYHLGMDDDLLLDLPEIIPHVQLVQLGDGRHSPLGEMNRCLLGDGRVPIPAILETLANCGYDRWIEIEVLGQDVELLGYDTVLDRSMRYLEQFRDLVEQVSPGSTREKS